MAFSFLEYLFSFQRYSRFCILSDDVISGSTNTVQHSIKNISGSIHDFHNGRPPGQNGNYQHQSKTSKGHIESANMAIVW